ncbi:MAG: outer membrane beta-barrel protein [Rhodobacter sp.]|nr:outer membrane beta-barrel protein [Paracoccaceae bacterium]MCC0076977.1 outer membrane beta-barrel protein [Rhodobacter sp.]
MKIKGAILAAAVAAAASPVYADATQWSGLSFGATVSNARVSGGGQGSTNRLGLALRGGYNWAVGENLVVGAHANAMDLSGANGGRGGPNIRRIYDVRLQVGYTLGNGLLYAGIGAAQGAMGAAGNRHDGSVVAFGFQSPMIDHVDFQVEVASYHFQSGGGGGAGPGGGNPQSMMLTVGFVYRH